MLCIWKQHKELKEKQEDVNVVIKFHFNSCKNLQYAAINASKWKAEIIWMSWNFIVTERT